LDLAEKRPGYTTSPNRTGGAVALVLHARLNPADGPRETPVRDVLSPSLRARIGDSGRAAATKSVNPATMGPLFSPEGL